MWCACCSATVKLHREQFWESISKFLISERIIWKMAYGIRYLFTSRLMLYAFFPGWAECIDTPRCVITQGARSL